MQPAALWPTASIHRNGRDGDGQAPAQDSSALNLSWLIDFTNLANFRTRAAEKDEIFAWISVWSAYFSAVTPKCVEASLRHTILFSE
jgi:hypothetical protein